MVVNQTFANCRNNTFFPSIAAAAGGILNVHYDGNWFTPAIWNEAELDEDKHNKGVPIITKDKALPIVAVYPNPSDGVIRFSIQDQKLQMESYDMLILDNTGRVIYRNVFTSNMEWHCNTCPRGLYHYRIVSQSRGKTQSGNLILN